MSDIHVVLGAAGAVGELLVGVLAERGEQVRAVGRRELPPRTGVHNVVADLVSAEGAARAVAGAGVVYVCVQPPYTRWRQEFPALARVIADASTVAGARLVLLDNLYGYGPVRGPIHEDLPQLARTGKGGVRAAIAADLLARHARGDLAVSIGRASDFVGPRGDSLPNLLTIERVAAGKPGRWMGRLDQPHSLSHPPDVARFLAELGTHDHAFGRAWHLPVIGSPTGHDFVALAHRVAGIDAAPGLITPLMNRVAGLFVPEAREGNELMYEFTMPFVVADQAFTSTFPAAPPTSLAAAVEASITGRR